ncbi:hypothetical protein FQN53_008442, partial [Emmonsiellopsis sp. PD_33]
MSNEAYQAERDLNTYQAKTGHGQAGVSDTRNLVSTWDGPGATAGGIDDRIITPEEGGRVMIGD